MWRLDTDTVGYNPEPTQRCEFPHYKSGRTVDAEYGRSVGMPGIEC
jgi:hypothetical protein